MKKLFIVVLLAAFTAACTNSGIENDYETEIQIIDKEHAERPGKQGGGCQEQEEQQSGND